MITRDAILALAANDGHAPMVGSPQQSAQGGSGRVYTITRREAGGRFYVRIDGDTAGYEFDSGKLRSCKAAAQRHNGAPLEWVRVDSASA